MKSILKNNILIITTIVLTIVVFVGCGKEQRYSNKQVSNIFEYNNSLYFVSEKNSSTARFSEYTDMNRTFQLFKYNKNLHIWKVNKKFKLKIGYYSDDYPKLAYIDKNNLYIGIGHYFLNSIVIVNLSNNKYKIINDIDRSSFINIEYQNNRVIEKDIETNQTIFEDILPTAEDIANKFSIDLLDNYSFKCHIFKTNQYKWDRDKYICTIAQNMHNGSYDDYYAFYIFKKNNNWNMQKIDGNSSKQSEFNYHIREANHLVPFYKSLDGRVTLCDNYIRNFSVGEDMYCFLFDKKNNSVEFKKLFGEIYPKEYHNFLLHNSNKLKYPFTFTFDKDKNMYLFYNDSDSIKNKKYDYYLFSFFKKDNPSKPLYTQKIEW